MEHTMRHTLACTLALLLSAPASQAYELYNHNGTTLNANLEALFGIFHSDESFNQFGNRQPGSSNWREGYVKYGLSASQAIADSGALYGAFSLLSSATWGDGDAAGFTQGDERRTAIEDLYLGWRSGSLFPALGEDGIDISGGRQLVTLGDGFLIQGDPVNAGNVDLGANSTGAAPTTWPRAGLRPHRRAAPGRQAGLARRPDVAQVRQPLPGRQRHGRGQPGACGRRRHRRPELDPRPGRGPSLRRDSGPGAP
jgi:hypothetical protein